MPLRVNTEQATAGSQNIDVGSMAPALRDFGYDV